MKKIKKKKFSLKREYKDGFNYLKKSRKYIWFSLILFFGIFLIVFAGLQSQKLNSVLIEKLREILLEFEGLGMWQIIIKIFLNNLFASFLGILLGIFFGIAPVFFIATNAYLIGFVSRLSVKESGFIVLWKLIPHGIFEFPAVIISFSLGIKLGMFVFSRYPWKTLKNYMENSARIFILIILPLLIFAAVIEGLLIWLIS